jgi:enterochelin esterase-like enzyme
VKVVVLLLLVAAGVLGAGSYGAYAYLHDYDLYRGFPPPSEPASIPHGRLEHVGFFSPALGRRRSYLVYLPPGYAREAAAGRRFPVLYLLHAPVGKARNYVQTGDLGVHVDELLHRRAIRPFITVIPLAHSPVGTDHEWANGNQGPYENFVLDTVRAVDARWATRPNRSARMLAGLSAGAYGATNITLHHLDRFGSFESWSGYYLEDTKDAFHGASGARLRANSPLDELGPRAAELRRLPVRAYLYQGRTDDEPASQMDAFAERLRATGSHVRVSVYGGKHNWALWRSHFSQMLEFASHTRWGRA